VVEELHRLVAQIEASRREAIAYREQIMPRSESALESAQAGWMANRLSFREVLDARRMLLEARAMEVRAVGEQWDVMAELALCCGVGDLEALQMLGAAPVEPADKP
jgi:outer membrane protein TolC